MFNSETMSQLKTVAKSYEAIFAPLCQQLELTQLEVDILLFLHNHPTKDTASHIVELRMLAKSNVSQGVESLIHKELLLRFPDEKDRRRIHLRPSTKAEPVLRRLTQVQNQWNACLFDGFSEEEHQLLHDLTQRIFMNAKSLLERK